MYYHMQTECVNAYNTELIYFTSNLVLLFVQLDRVLVSVLVAAISYRQLTLATAGSHAHTLPEPSTHTYPRPIPTFSRMPPSLRYHQTIPSFQTNLTAPLDGSSFLKRGFTLFQHLDRQVGVLFRFGGIVEERS